MRPMLGGCQRPKTVSPCLEHTQVRLQKRKHAPRLRTNLFSHDKLHSECPLFQCQEISLNQTRANAKRPLYIRGERPQPQQQRIPHAPSESRQTCMGSFVAHSPDSRPRLDQFFSFSSPFIISKEANHTTWQALIEFSLHHGVLVLYPCDNTRPHGNHVYLR